MHSCVYLVCLCQHVQHVAIIHTYPRKRACFFHASSYVRLFSLRQFFRAVASVDICVRMRVCPASPLSKICARLSRTSIRRDPRAGNRCTHTRTHAHTHITHTHIHTSHTLREKEDNQGGGRKAREEGERAINFKSLHTLRPCPVNSLYTPS